MEGGSTTASEAYKLVDTKTSNFKREPVPGDYQALPGKICGGRG